jgi:phosphosulfolactate phosphohydrolase-like enzyme
VLAGSFLNLAATVERVRKLAPENLLLVGSGTADQAAYEDALAAGALCDLVWEDYRDGAIADSARIARRLFQIEQENLLAAVSESRNGRRLLTHAELRDDVSYCLQRDTVTLVAVMERNEVRREK